MRQAASQWLDTVGGHWRRRIAWNVLVAAAMALTGLLLFAKIGEDVFQHESGSFGDGVRTLMLAHQSSSLSALHVGHERGFDGAHSGADGGR